MKIVIIDEYKKAKKTKELEVLLTKVNEKVHILNVAVDIEDELFKTGISDKYLPKQTKTLLLQPQNNFESATLFI